MKPVYARALAGTLSVPTQVVRSVGQDAVPYVGETDAASVYVDVGANETATVGALVSADVGINVGETEGPSDGADDNATVGASDGVDVGIDVAETVVASTLPNEPVPANELLKFPERCILPVIGTFTMFADKFNVSFPSVCNLTNL